MRKRSIFAAVMIFASALLILAQQPFQVISAIAPATIAGRPIHRDASGKLLPWPIPEDTGYSYNSHLLTQWNIIWDQFNRQRYQYFFC